MRTLTMVLALGLTALWGSGITAAEVPKGDKPVVRESKLARPLKGFGAFNQPIEIKTEEEAAKFFGKDTVAAVKKDVDFSKDKLLCFEWAGSGADKLTYDIVNEKDAWVVVFKLTPGKTRDFVMHARSFVLPKATVWHLEEKTKQ